MNNIIKLLLAYFLIVVTTTTSLYSQEKESVPDIEKTYLHIDRSSYVMGENLWYKAYLVYAYNNLLFNHSNILYVELISPDSKILASNKTRLAGGIGHGDFKLTDSLGVKKPGIYQIRAYTNWTRNFGYDFVFKKDIEILDVFESERIANIDNESSKLEPKEAYENTFQTKEKKISLQFFPEGGSLVENISSVVAFKAVDNNGSPIEAQGQILDVDDELITMFRSVHDGMGKFQLKPVKGKQYRALITSLNNAQIEVPLPKVSEHGYLLSYRQIKEHDILTIKTNAQTLLKRPNPVLTIRYATRGIPYFEETISLTGSMVSLELPKANLPEGISQITLYDAELRPESERLVYIEKNQDLKVEISTDKKSYNPKEKVIVNVSSKNNLGEAVPASYSLASTDLNGAKDPKDAGTNICSYFLMESDIRGKVYNPGYYFDTSNPNRFQHFDLLLLTQGWRDFLWKKLPEVKNGLTYNVEKGINIRGTVKQLFGTKPVEDNTVSLALFHKKLDVFNSITDSLGAYKFEDVMITGKARMVLTTKNKRGRNNGIIVLDSIFELPMAVDFKGNKVSSGFSSEINLISNNIYKKYVAFEVLPENVLGEVEIVAEKIDDTKDVNIHGKMFKGYVLDEESPKFSDIFELLRYAVPSLDANTQESIRFGSNTGGALISINQTRLLDPDPEYDGPIMVRDYLSGIMPEDILKIEYDNSAVATMMFGSQAKNGVILIYTKSNADIADKKTRNDLSSIKQQVEGYYDARLFYAPNLAAPDTKLDNNNAIRNTLYWNPYVHPDETGTSNIEYYNSAVETNVKVTLEGITATGIPVVVKTYYTIEK